MTDLMTNLVTRAGEGTAILTRGKNTTLWMARRANVTFRRVCPAAELPGTADRKGQGSADSSLLEDGCVAQRCSQLCVRWSSTQHRLSVGAVTGLAKRLS